MILKTKNEQKEINLMGVIDVDETEINEIILNKEEAKVAIFKLTFFEKLRKLLTKEDLFYIEYVENNIKIIHDFYKDEDEEIEKRVVITVIPPFYYNNGYILARYEEKYEYNEEFKIINTINCYNKPCDFELNPYDLIDQHYCFKFSTFGECETIIKKLIKNHDGVETICNEYLFQEDIYKLLEEVEKIIGFDKVTEYYENHSNVEMNLKLNDEIIILKKVDNIFFLYYQSLNNERLIIQITPHRGKVSKTQIKIGLDEEEYKYDFYKRIEDIFN